MRTVYPIGTTIYDPERCFNGYTLMNFYAHGEGVGVLIVDMNGNIVHEWPISVLREPKLLKNGNLSRSAHDVGLGMFRELLGYKAIEAGVEVVMVNPAYTSQVCSGCGCIIPKSLGVRNHACTDCGLILDRDVNAALNIVSAGTRRSDANVDGCIMRSPRSSLLHLRQTAGPV